MSTAPCSVMGGEHGAARPLGVSGGSPRGPHPSPRLQTLVTSLASPAGTWRAPREKAQQKAQQMSDYMTDHIGRRPDNDHEEAEDECTAYWQDGEFVLCDCPVCFEMIRTRAGGIAAP